MPLSGSWSRFKLAVLALLLAGSALAVYGQDSPARSLSPSVVPQEQAARFCSLLVCDNDSRVMPLSAFVRQQSLPQDDSLTIEQLFLVYVVDYNGWQSLRIFPYKADDGTARWYAAADDLPAGVSEEHRKYIHEVFPRLMAEVKGGNWKTVEAYIDRMVQYQCRFGAGRQTSQPSSYAVIAIFFVVTLLSLALFSVFQRCSRSKKAKIFGFLLT